MLRKMLLGAVAAAGLMFVGMSDVDAGWRRDVRRGYYAPYNGGYSYRASRRASRRGYYNSNYYTTPYYYGNSYPGYYGYNGVYYQPYNYSGVGVSTPGFGFYIR